MNLTGAPPENDTNTQLKRDTELFRLIGKESEPGVRRYGKLKRCSWDSDYVFSVFCICEELCIIISIISDLRFRGAMHIYGMRSDSPF